MQCIYKWDSGKTSKFTAHAHRMPGGQGFSIYMDNLTQHPCGQSPGVDSAL